MKGSVIQYQHYGRKTAYSRANEWSNYTECSLKEDQLCFFSWEDKRLEMGESGVWYCPYVELDKVIHLCHISTKQRIHGARVDGFCSVPPFMCRHFLFISLPCWSRLHGSPQTSIEEFAFPIWCASTAQYTRILPHRSKASEEFIKRNYSQKKKKERGEEDQDIRDVARNKLDGYPILVERTSKGKGGTTSVKLGEKIQISKKDVT